MEPKVVNNFLQQRKNLLHSDVLQKVVAFGCLIALMIVFSILSPNFFTFSNLVGIMLATAVIGILALGVTFVIITGGIDLSIGTVMTFSSVVAGVIISYWHLSSTLGTLVGILGGILAGGFCGLINGLLISKLKIPPFIATLGMMNVTKGLSLIITGTKPIYFNDSKLFPKVAMDSVLGRLIGLEIPNSVTIFFIVALLASFILSKTVLGRFNFALGSNEEATRLSGVNVNKWKILIYMLCGLFCGLAGILMASRINSAQPALGSGYELEAIAAVVIGGTSLSGGTGTIFGTFIGAFIMSVLTNGLRILSVAQEWQTVVVGAVIILAVFMDTLRQRKN